LENNYKVTFENKSCVIKDQNNKKEWSHLKWKPKILFRWDEEWTYIIDEEEKRSV
jgi:hypothetical protein